MNTQSQFGEWTVRRVGESKSYPATIPGCVHTDLLAAGAIDDPYIGERETDVRWIGYADWEYTSEFSWNAGDNADPYHLDLECDGLDTAATISINGIKIASTQNMHRRFRWNIDAVITPGRNTISIRFDSAIQVANQNMREHGPLPEGYEHPYNFIRKMASNFGWDWGPTFVTAGIWRPIRLVKWRNARLLSASAVASVNPETGDGLLDVLAELSYSSLPDPASADAGLTLMTAIDGTTIDTIAIPNRQDSERSIRLNVPNVELWWPRSHGSQRLYTIEITLLSGDTILDSVTQRVGFKTVELRSDRDEFGREFTLAINGTPLFIRGANWIPNDCFVAGLTADDYRERLDQAVAANMNLVRVWGGGIYEDDRFYDICDELGILVWQDFALACAGYPETEPHWSEIEAEAVDNLKRLRSHASLSLWCGSNELLLGWYDWGWEREVGDVPWGLGYLEEMFPRLVEAHSAHLPYIPSSPWASEPDTHPNHPDDGPSHLWDVWGSLDYVHYRDSIPRFAAEYGYQSPPSWSTLTRAIHDDPLTPTSPGMLAHQKQPGSNERLTRNLVGHYPAPTNIEDWHLATSLNQAHALSLAIEHLRSWSPRSMGSIIWQLNDCWPVMSWAIIDSNGCPKPAWFSVQRSYADRLVTIQPREAGLALVLVNDSDEQWDATVDLALHNICRPETPEVAVEVVDIQVAARSTTTWTIPASMRSPHRRREELLVADTGDLRAYWAFVQDEHMRWPAALWRVSVTEAEPRADSRLSAEITLTAETALLDVVICADRVDTSARVDSSMLLMLPGETRVFRVEWDADAAAEPQDFLKPGVIRAANDLWNATGLAL